jgi:hypothetical protein
MNRSRIKQTALAITATATVAALVGIATGAAAPSNGSSNGNPPRPSFEYGTAVGPGPGPGPGFAVAGAISGKGKGRVTFRAPEGGPGPIGGPPVHSEMVVPNKSGNGFITVTGDDGKVNSVSGNQLTVTEGTDTATYKTVTLDVPSDATVVRDGKKSQLSDLQKGDQVHVSQSPDGSFVFATDSAFQQKMQREFRQHFKNLPKPPSGVPGGMPPGLPPAAFGRRGN